MNSFFLADHTFAEIIFHGQQLLVFALHEAADGNARPVGHDFGHGIGVDAVRHHRNVFRRAVVASHAGRTILGRRLVLFGLCNLLLDGRNFAIVDGGGFRQIAFALVPFGLGAQFVELLAQVADAVVSVLFGVPACFQTVEFFAFVCDFLIEVVETFLGTFVKLAFGFACGGTVFRIAKQV